MSLSLNIKRFKTIKIKLPKYARVEFRSDSKITAIYSQTDEYLEINESFQWDLGDRPLRPGETLEVTLIARSRWNNEKILGVYRLGLQVLTTDHSLEIIDALVSDQTNQSSMVFVEMQVFYDAAGVTPGTAEQTAGFTKMMPATIPKVHTSGQARRPSGTQELAPSTSVTQNPTTRYALASRQAYTAGRSLTSPLPLTCTSFSSRQDLPSPTSRPAITSFMSRPGLTSPPSRRVITSPTSRPGLTSPPSRRVISSPTSRPILTSPPSRRVITSPTSRPGLTSPPSRSSPTSRPGLASPPLRPAITPSTSRPGLASPPLRPAITPSASRPGLASPPSRPAITPSTSRPGLASPPSRRAMTSSTPRPGYAMPVSRRIIKSPTPRKGSSASALSGTQTSPKPKQVVKSPTQRDSASELPLTHTSPKPQPDTTSPIRQQGLPSPSRKGSAEAMPSTNRPSIVRQATPSPAVRQTLTSPSPRQGSTSPQAYKPVSSSLPSAFHQALISKYAMKNDREQTALTHKSSSSLSSQQGSRQSSPRDSAQSSPQSDGNDTDLLIHVERNIATLEKSLKNKETVIDIDLGEENTLSRGSKLKQVGKRIFRRHWSFGDTSAERAAKYAPASELVPKHKTKKISTFRSVKNLMRMVKPKRRDSNCDEEIELLDIATGPSAPEISTTHTSESSEDAVLVDMRSPPDTPKITKKTRNVMEIGGPIALKAADFQVCVTIIEARQLAGLNMDPIVAVQVGDNKKYTSVKESTNCPYYNEYFVFDFHMPPVMLLDKIITLSVQQSRHILRSNKLLGSFKLDVATVWNQPDRQFYHKWALLTDPDDITSGPKGYLKCDISVIGKGDQIKVPPKSEKDEDDVEANLLLPDGVPIDRQHARFLVRIHKADGLPQMNYSLMANVKKAFTGESQDLVDPYVEVSFAGMTGQTSALKNTNSPIWNEQIIFTEMFPPLCQRIKIQLKDHDSLNHQNSNVIGTHFMDLRKISNDGDRGFLPTFGPAYVHLYGSTRDYSLIDQHSNLNDGMGEGVSYRGRILISIRTEIMDILECPQSTDVELECLPPISDSALGKNQDFFLFASIFEATMIDKRFIDKSLTFELSIGNCGNSLDGNSENKKASDYFIQDIDDLKVDTGFWQSTTPPCKAVSADNLYCCLSIWDHKPCMQIRSVWPDHRQRMYNSNIISNIVEVFEEGLADTEVALSNDNHDASLLILKATLEAASNACASYVRHMSSAPALGKTKLDRERQKQCLHELGKMTVLAKNLKVLITKHSMKDRLRTAYTYLNKLKHLCEDPQHAMPDIFIWLLSGGKRVAYHRVPAREIIYSDVPDETGKYCAKVQTLFLKWPGKKASSPSGWVIPAKVSIYLWLGVVQDKTHFIDGIPPGFEETSELTNAGFRLCNAPRTIFYTERHKFQMRAYIYQARSLIGSDASGLSDPFARIIINDETQTTQVIDQTLSPTWDETLVFENITLFSTIESIKENPPTVVIEIFDQDSVGKSEFIGRTIVKPYIKSLEDIRLGLPYLPALEWHDIRRGDDMAGELLATFELLELVGDEDKTKELPELPSPRLSTGKPPVDFLCKGPILPVPLGIRPTLSKYRIEVLFWGLRDLKRVHFLTVDKPRVDIECSGHTLTSTVIQNAKRNPNFNNPTKFIELELPDQDVYQPPLTIRVVDCRSFGRNVLVGTHTINSIQKYIYTPMSKKEREIEDRKKSLIQLQNVDLRANCIIQEDVFTIGHERDNMPLLPRGAPLTYGPRTRNRSSRTRSLDRGTRGSRRRKTSADSTFNDDDEIGCKDWWTKYFASYDVMIEEMKEKSTKVQSGQLQQASTSEGLSPRSGRNETNSPVRSDRECGGARRKIPQSPKKKSKPSTSKSVPPTTNKNQVPKSTLTKVYPHELEAVPEYEEFKEWLNTYELYRGKKTGDDTDEDNRMVGSFKGAIKVYKWPLPKSIDDSTIMGHDPNYGFFQGVPKNEPIHVLIRVYIVKATDLHPMDLNGKADPYIVLHIGNKRIADTENYVSKQLNPVFGKCYEIEATFPQDSKLTISVFDWDLVGADENIGETKIDLENRFYSRHRATCGLPQKYEETGFNRWRDSLKPTQILAKLCKDGKLEPPIYEQTRIRIGRTVFNMPLDDTELFSNADYHEEQMALVVLHRWHEVPRVGCHLVKEHVETRPLYNPTKPGIEQGRLEMWIDMFPMDMPAPGPPVDISPRKPKSFELRVVIWNTDDVVLEDDAFFTGEKMSDIYVKGWLKGSDDCQSTDTHYRSLTGEGNFNWRFIYPFEYLEAEERIVTSRKESVFSWDETECKIPARLELQVWDADHFTSDDFLGALTLDLNRFPRGAKSAKLCTLEMLCNDGAVPTISIFKQKRVRGWWPFYVKQDTEEMELTGKVDAEIHLLTREEADLQPAGFGRSEPDALEKPNRPDSSFMWFLNPLKSMRYILWHNHKWGIVKWGLICSFFLAVFLLLFAFPGYLAKKLLGA